MFAAEKSATIFGDSLTDKCLFIQLVSNAFLPIRPSAM